MNHSCFTRFWGVLALFVALAASVSAAQPLTVSVTSNDTNLPSACTFTGTASDSDGDLIWIHFYVNGPGMPGWNHVGSAWVGGSGSSATGSVQWTAPIEGHWAVHIRAQDSTNAYDSNGNVMAVFRVRAPMANPTSSNYTINTGTSWAPSISAPPSNGTGALMYAVAGFTNYQSGNWTPPGAGTYNFWVGQRADENHYGNVTDPIQGPMQVNTAAYTLTVVTPPNQPPYIAFDAASSAYNGQTFTGSGWAADPDNGAPVDRVEIWVDGAYRGNAMLGGDRLDVANAYGRSDFRYSGFSYSITLSGLTPGGHTVVARAFDGNNAYSEGSRSFTVQSGTTQVWRPEIRQDVWVPGSSYTVWVNGYEDFELQYSWEEVYYFDEEWRQWVQDWMWVEEWVPVWVNGYYQREENPGYIENRVVAPGQWVTVPVVSNASTPESEIYDWKWTDLPEFPSTTWDGVTIGSDFPKWNWANWPNNWFMTGPEDDDDPQLEAILPLAARERWELVSYFTTLQKLQETGKGVWISKAAARLLGAALLRDIWLKVQMEKKLENEPWSFVVYEKLQPVTHRVYTGRAAGPGDPISVMARRDATHYILNQIQGYHSAELSSYVVANGGSSFAEAAMRGREQQVMDYHGGCVNDRGGYNVPNPDTGRKRASNKIRGVRKDHLFSFTFWAIANAAHGNVYKHTGNNDFVFTHFFMDVDGVLFIGQFPPYHWPD
jgi:hypothetical protein